MSTVMSTARTTPTIPGSRPTNPIPRLRRGVSLIVGMDNQPMLFDSDSGKYHRLGAAAAFIVGQFDGVRPLPTIIEELPQDIDELTAHGPQHRLALRGLGGLTQDRGLKSGTGELEQRHDVPFWIISVLTATHEEVAPSACHPLTTATGAASRTSARGVL